MLGGWGKRVRTVFDCCLVVVVVVVVLVVVVVMMMMIAVIINAQLTAWGFQVHLQSSK